MTGIGVSVLKMLKSMIQNVRVGLRNDDSISKTQIKTR